MTKWGQWIDSHLEVFSRSGDECVCRCVFHDDSHPSMYVNEAKGLFHCKSCDAHGRISLIGNELGIEAYPSPPSLAELQTSLDGLIEPEPDRPLPEAWLDQFLMRAHPYWTERGIDPDVQVLFKLGYDRVYNAATIPVRDSQGRLHGVIRRRLAENSYPRYLEPKGFLKRECLWGSWRVTERRIAVCEGPIDALALWSVGIQAVALLGSSISKHQHHLLHRLGAEEIVVMTDNDRAGSAAVKQIQDRVKGILVSVADYPLGAKGNDPAALSRRDRRKMFATAAPMPILL